MCPVSATCIGVSAMHRDVCCSVLAVAAGVHLPNRRAHMATVDSQAATRLLWQLRRRWPQVPRLASPHTHQTQPNAQPHLSRLAVCCDRVFLVHWTNRRSPPCTPVDTHVADSHGHHAVADAHQRVMRIRSSVRPEPAEPACPRAAGPLPSMHRRHRRLTGLPISN